MASHSFTVASTLPRDLAYARLVDLESVPEWDHGVRSSTRIDRENAVLGSRFEVTVTGFDGAPATVVYEITEAEAPNRFVMVGQNEVFRAEDELTLASVGDGCVLTYVGRLALLGDNPPLTDAQLDSMFPKLAAVAETGLTSFLNPAD